MAIVQMVFIDLVIIGITIEVIARLYGRKISAVAFFAIAIASLGMSILADRLAYEETGHAHLYTGAIVAAAVSIAYLMWGRRSDTQKGSNGPRGNQSQR